VPRRQRLRHDLATRRTIAVRRLRRLQLRLPRRLVSRRGRRPHHSELRGLRHRQLLQAVLRTRRFADAHRGTEVLGMVRPWPLGDERAGRSLKNDLLANSRSELLGGEAGAAGEEARGASFTSKTSRLLMANDSVPLVERCAIRRPPCERPVAIKSNFSP